MTVVSPMEGCPDHGVQTRTVSDLTCDGAPAANQSSGDSTGKHNEPHEVEPHGFSEGDSGKGECECAKASSGANTTTNNDQAIFHSQDLIAGTVGEDHEKIIEVDNNKSGGNEAPGAGNDGVPGPAESNILPGNETETSISHHGQNGAPAEASSTGSTASQDPIESSSTSTGTHTATHNINEQSDHSVRQPLPRASPSGAHSISGANPGMLQTAMEEIKQSLEAFRAIDCGNVIENELH